VKKIPGKVTIFSQNIKDSELYASLIIHSKQKLCEVCNKQTAVITKINDRGQTCCNAADNLLKATKNTHTYELMKTV